MSTAADYCSYLPDADNSSITPSRLVDATARVLALGRTAPRVVHEIAAATTSVTWIALI